MSFEINAQRLWKRLPPAERAAAAAAFFKEPPQSCWERRSAPS